LITYPRTDGNAIEPASADTAPKMGKNIIDVLSPAAMEMLLPPTNDHVVPEPGAVPSSDPVDWSPKPVIVPEGWVDPDSFIKPGDPDEYKPTCSFAAPPRATVLPVGTAVYRVIGKTADGRIVQRVDGSWWSLERPPSTEAEWRARYAVCGHWNGDGGYIEFRLTKEVKAWVGEVAAHRSTTDGYVLPGGGTQVWVPSGTIDPIREGYKLDDILRPTPWRAKEMGL